MIHLGLTGFPLDQSLSPRIHSVALDYCGLEGDFSLFPVRPDDRHGLKALLARVCSGEIRGLNVTIPHKQAIIPLLDELTPTAKAIGAVNTIYLNDGRLIGHNTDAQGFLAELNHLEIFSAFKKKPSALVLGAGGSARAVVYVLTNNGWNVTIAARRTDQATELAGQFTGIHVVEFNVQTFQSSSPQLIVNTTPIGMIPNVGQSPWPAALPFPSHTTVYDLVYNPPETKLVRDARIQGLNAMNGLGMLVEQAALAFELWTGRRVGRDALFLAMEEK